MSLYDAALIAAGAATSNSQELSARSRQRSIDLFNDLALPQRGPILDPNPLVSVLCPRRAGKTFMTSVAALMTGEANPGSITLIMSLTLKALKRNYWLGSRSGLPYLNQKYGLGLTFNSSELRWQHENGSIGYLLGAEDRTQMEYIRGIEADLYIVDECKSFAPSILDELIRDIILPQRISRRGRLMLIGTPGHIFAGPFWEATCPEARSEPTDEFPKGRPFSVPHDQDDPYGRPRRHLWSAHSWSLQDNEKMAHQWSEALDLKAMKEWADDNPTWLREYMGRWTNTHDGLVYNYVEHRSTPEKVNWTPNPTEANPTGLPQDKGPWHLVMGLDLGYEDPTALVVGAWSSSHPELRHIHDEKHPHLLVPDVIDLVQRNIARFGMPETIAVDTGGSMGKSFAETLSRLYGLPVVAAKKQEKFEYIELLNGDFSTGRVKIRAGTALEEQLMSVQFDLSDGAKAELAHKGRLREDPSCPNDVSDAFLYMWRECHHHFAKQSPDQPRPGSLEWWEKREAAAYQAACRQHSVDEHNKGRGLVRETVPFGNRRMPQALWRGIP
jgi:hypothetical protein